MKKIIITDPIFTPSTKTVDTKIDNFDIRKLYAIINQTTGNLIYGTGIPGKGFTSVTDSTIVLQFDTTSMSAIDILQFLYDDNEDTQWLQNIYESVDTLTFLAGLRGPAANLRVTVTDGVVNVGSGYLNTVNIGGYGSQPQVPSTINIGAIQSNINNININIS
jgi:hypothetical protein